jgi:hypothetical protein
MALFQRSSKKVVHGQYAVNITCNNHNGQKAVSGDIYVSIEFSTGRKDNSLTLYGEEFWHLLATMNATADELRKQIAIEP